jgi:hypothetical protein
MRPVILAVSPDFVLAGHCVVVLMLVRVPDDVALYVSAGDDVVLAALAQSQLLFLCPRLKERKRKALIYVYVFARVSVHVYASVRMRMGVC